MKTTFVRNFVTYAVILLSALLIVGFAFQIFTKQYLEDKVVENLKQDCSAVCQVAQAYADADSLQSKDFRVNLAVAARVSETDVVICNNVGRILVCSDSPFGCQHQAWADADH